MNTKYNEMQHVSKLLAWTANIVSPTQSLTSVRMVVNFSTSMLFILTGLQGKAAVNPYTFPVVPVNVSNAYLSAVSICVKFSLSAGVPLWSTNPGY